ncbi:hypothetical protein [Leptolyngbya sp. O-77]|uniref:hypothetical protein n=1 Tax=Leptolyngbya sp. O-77 TaxID=1080068 RepID=UPI00074D47E0|nr:hypothetical protein [Leptolyngbya sp. O-77]BAU40720.1 hypothetical protein O77CONTIG1_00524 [Leptolyngbya sp. O-77]
MYGWIPIVLYLFTRYSPPRAVIISFVVAWLFLPQAAIVLPSIPDYTKMSATCYGILLAVFVFDSGRFSTFKPGWIDGLMVLYCISPFISSMANGLGAYDGVSSSLEQVVSWGLPYLFGRLYLSNLAGMKHLAIAIFAGGLVYIPFTIYESRFSPQLHRMVYGYHARADFSQTMRMGGYRPTVFMAHGLAVGAWMMAAALVGIWLWKSGVLKKFWDKPMKTLVPVLVISFLNCRSTGAYLLLVFGLLILFLGSKLKTYIPLILLVIFISTYLYMGATGYITPDRRDSIEEFVTKTLNAERAQSLIFRLENEELLSEKARQRPVFGWGGWGRARVYDDYGKDISVTDSLWIIAFGNQGAFGLITLFSTMIVPSFLLCAIRYPPKVWAHPLAAPAVCVAVVTVLFALDCVLNAMPNPIFTLSSGGIAGLVLKPESLRKRVPKRKPAPRSLPRRRPSLPLASP